MLSRYILLSLVVSCGYGLQAKRFSQPMVTVQHETADSSSVEEGTYQPTWESIDSRPLPSWYDQSKIGVFFHWGVFSVPSFDNEWFWFSWVNNHSNVVSFMEQNYPPRFTYQDFGREFTAEFYDPHRWVKTLKKSGAKYIVLTSKHHEGYTLWPSKYSFSWNAGDVGPKRDLLGDLASALREDSDIRFGIYHSWFEFFNPLYWADKNNLYKTDKFVQNKAFPELQELVTKYKPDVIWSDGDWEATDTYWKSKEFLAWLYNSSPVKDTVVVNDRWGKNTTCLHGGFFTCQDKYNPGKVLPYKWENAMTIDKGSWGFRRTAGAMDYLTPQELIYQLVSTVSCGGNFLINVGPTKDGMIAPILEERLLQMGQWLDINGDAIYESNPWKLAQNDSSTKGVWYTSKEKRVFAIILEQAWPQEEDQDGKIRIVLGSVDPKAVDVKEITMLGQKDLSRTLPWAPCDGKRCMKGILVTLPTLLPPNSAWAWTLKITLN